VGAVVVTIAGNTVGAADVLSGVAVGASVRTVTCAEELNVVGAILPRIG
jgi:hypothetical protein